MVFFPTGTRAYGPAREDSDLDIVVRSDHAKELERNLNLMGFKAYRTEIQLKQRYPGFYVDLNGLTLNIIVCANQVDMDAWQHATVSMRKLRTPIEDREKRLAKFGDFFEAYQKASDDLL